jgi:hypothetical protein
MNAHVIENGIVVNTIVVDSLDFMPNLVEATSGAIGWRYDGNTFTNPNAPTQQQIDEKKSLSIRLERNEKLQSCDWTQVADAQVDKTVWATYRQALRDITAQDGFPWTITWPDAP